MRMHTHWHWPQPRASCDNELYKLKARGICTVGSPVACGGGGGSRQCRLAVYALARGTTGAAAAPIVPLAVPQRVHHAVHQDTHVCGHGARAVQLLRVR